MLYLLNPKDTASRWAPCPMRVVKFELQVA